MFYVKILGIYKSNQNQSGLHLKFLKTCEIKDLYNIITTRLLIYDPKHMKWKFNSMSH